MSPDTPLCESLRPTRRRLQLLGQCPSFHSARPDLAQAAGCGLGAGRQARRAHGEGQAQTKVPRPPANPGAGCCPLSDPSQDLAAPKASPEGQTRQHLVPAWAAGRAGRGRTPLRGTEAQGHSHRPFSPFSFSVGRVLPAPSTLSPLVSLGIGSSFLGTLIPSSSSVVDSLSPSLWPPGRF